MIAFIENPQLLINEFNELIDTAQTKAFITVGIEIQKDEIEVLRTYRDDLKKLKSEFISKKLENEANLVFLIDNSIHAIQLELEMLVNIKEDNMSAAWGSLVQAQVTIGTVIRNHFLDASFLDGFVDRLSAYEKLLFPSMMFHSVGGIIRKSLCSICNDDYNKCDHLKGNLYMGEMCVHIITKMDLEEASVVENPANKLCRTISIQVNGKSYDTLTLRTLDKDSDETIDKE
ncbi:MAG: hypothetical protein R2820_07210 [Cyclobacteriaceae bacterium]